MADVQIACAKTVRYEEKKGTYQLQPAIVHCQDTQISRVEVFATEKEWQQEVERRKGQDGFLILLHHILTPAFVNAHTHVSMGFFRGVLAQELQKRNLMEDLFFTVESHLTPEDVFSFARMGAYESLLAGVGVVWEHYYYGMEIAAALEEVGLVGVIAPTLQDLKGPGVANFDVHWQACEQLYRRQSMPHATSFLAMGPHAPDSVSDVLWQRILAQARSWNVPMHFHLGQSQDEYREVYSRTGLSPVGFLDKMGVWAQAPQTVCAHSIFVTKQDLSRLQDPRHCLVFCPSAQMVFEFPAAVLEWERAGLRWVVATDSVAGNDSMNLQKELRFASGVPRQQLSFDAGYQRFLQDPTGAPPQVSRKDEADFVDVSWILDKVWGNPGRLHPAFRAGTLEAGALANLVAWDLNHPSLWPGDSLRSIAFTDSLGAISNVMTAGKWRGEWGRFGESICASVAYQTAHMHAQKCYRALLLRCGF